MLRFLKRAWVPLVVVVAVALGGVTVNRLRGIFGSDAIFTATGSSAEPLQPSHLKQVTYEVYGRSDNRKRELPEERPAGAGELHRLAVDLHDHDDGARRDRQRCGTRQQRQHWVSHHCQRRGQRRAILGRAPRSNFLSGKGRMITEIEARPKYMRFVRRFAVPILIAWLLLTVALNVLVPPIESVARNHAVTMSPQDAPAMIAAKRIGEKYHESDSDSISMIVLESDKPLGEQAHRYYDGLVQKLQADQQHNC